MISAALASTTTPPVIDCTGLQLCGDDGTVKLPDLPAGTLGLFVNEKDGPQLTDSAYDGVSLEGRYLLLGPKQSAKAIEVYGSMAIPA